MALARQIWGRQVCDNDCVDLNACRKHLFTKRNCALELLPPTSNAFVQHVKRAIFQAVFVWGECLISQPHVVDPCLWGWNKVDNRLVPTWMTIPEVVYALNELVSCGCTKGCTGRCKCVKANLPCTALCGCDGECARQT